MTVAKVFTLGLIKDNTEIWIRDLSGEGAMKVLAHENWYQDNVLKYMDREVAAFHWQDDHRVYIDVK